jgi:hypothetical protein
METERETPESIESGTVISEYILRRLAYMSQVASIITQELDYVVPAKRVKDSAYLAH